jgi:hypothetical protein
MQYSRVNTQDRAEALKALRPTGDAMVGLNIASHPSQKAASLRFHTAAGWTTRVAERYYLSVRAARLKTKKVSSY